MTVISIFSKAVIFSLLFAIGGSAISQNIYSALHLNEENEYKTARPKQIRETNIFYKPVQKTETSLKIFDEAGMLLSEERFDPVKNLTSILTYSNDTVNRLILSRTFVRKSEQMGYSKETAFYTYDTNHFLVRITDKTATGSIITVSEIINNKEGNPTELRLLDGQGNPFGKEVATYFYDKNQLVTSVISNNGTPLTHDTITINFKKAPSFPSEGDLFNEHGDRVRSVRKNLNGSQTIFEEEYTYDEYGNITENRIYIVTIKRNGKKSRQLDRVFQKSYMY